jgi:hypothetical protein
MAMNAALGHIGVPGTHIHRHDQRPGFYSADKSGAVAA